VGVDDSLAVVVEHGDVLVGIVKFLALLPLVDGRVGSRRVGEEGEGGDAPIKSWVILLKIDKDFAEDFEEEEALLAHVDADQSWQIDIDTLVDRVAGVATKSYEEQLHRVRPGEFFPIHSNAVIVKALLLAI